MSRKEKSKYIEKVSNWLTSCTLRNEFNPKETEKLLLDAAELLSELRDNFGDWTE